MTLTNILYLEGCVKNKDDCVVVSIETYISLFFLIGCENFDTQINFVDMGNTLILSIPKKILENFIFHLLSKESITKLHCNLPLVKLKDQKTVIGGLCAVLRWTIKNITEGIDDHPAKALLGFRGGCLVSCAESSIWTKFCELDLPHATRNVISSELEITSSTVPAAILRLESHLKAPVRTHNILKRKQDLQKRNGLNNVTTSPSGDQETESNINMSAVLENLDKMAISEDFSLEHCYLEGIDFTLADVIVVSCVHSLLEKMSFCASCCLPQTVKWYRKISLIPSVSKAASVFSWTEPKSIDCGNFSDHCKEISSFPSINEGSLYSRATATPKIKSRNLKPVPLMDLLKENCIFPKYEENHLPKLSWNQLPSQLHPSSGELPEKRILKKCQQLENIVSAVCSIAQSCHVIVDFCSGGGHVGLLLAYLLPQCQILLVENKEDSLQRARKRAVSLNLENIQFYQCNLDYINTGFDIGVSLHACGVATDLVIGKCIAENAHFVCCPCCYGAIQQTDNLTYPLSKRFQSCSILYKDYATISHCADRTENNTAKLEQGIYCMGLVDADRTFHAEEYGYEVKLMKMDPVTCSPKHNLLLGKKIF